MVYTCTFASVDIWYVKLGKRKIPTKANSLSILGGIRNFKILSKQMGSQTFIKASESLGKTTLQNFLEKVPIQQTMRL